MQELTNRQLQLARIPDPDGDLRKWEMFAHTINGYQAAGSDERCAALYHDKSANTLTELRCALFSRPAKNVTAPVAPVMNPMRHVVYYAASARRWPQGSWSKPMPEDHEQISMEEQRRIHTRALSESGPPAAGETRPQKE